MNETELSETEAVEKLMRAIATKHAKRAAATPPDLNDPSAVVAWLEAAARAAEEEFDRLMGWMPPAADARRSRVQEMLETV